MARTIIAVIVGYVAMFVLVFVTFTGVFLLMGTEWSFKPGSFEASNGWIAMSFVANLVIGAIGGLICAAIAKGGKAPLILAIVVFVLGMLLAIPQIFANQAGANQVRTGNVSNLEAMQKATQPLWVPFTFPFVGAAGVLLGAKLKRR